MHEGKKKLVRESTDMRHSDHKDRHEGTTRKKEDSQDDKTRREKYARIGKRWRQMWKVSVKRI